MDLSPLPKKIIVQSLVLLVLTAGLTSVYLLTKQPQDLRRQAASSQGYPGDLTHKFQETTVLSLDNPSKIYGYFTTDYRAVTKSSTLPPTIQMSGDSVTFTDKGALVIDNPAKNSSFYRIEVLLTDNSQSNLMTYLNGIDALWDNNNTPIHGVSVGLNTTEAPNSYYYSQTQFKTQSQVTPAEWDFSQKVKDKFVKRHSGQIKLEFYVTPLGIYPVVDGANYISFPNLYTGAYLYTGGPLNYITLGKWNAGGNPVTFNSLKIITLDSSVATVDEVNAYFIEKTLNSDAFKTLISNQTAYNGTGGYQNALWVAFLYRAYDYYFKTNHQAQVQTLFDQYLAVLPTDINQNIGHYGGYNSQGTPYRTVDVNHSLINSLQASTINIWALSGYLRPDQLEQARIQFAKVLDISRSWIRTTSDPVFGQFPGTITYQNDTWAEEYEWLLNLYAGYVAVWPNDHPRVDLTLDYIKFLDFIMMSEGKSINQVFPNFQFLFLDDSFKNFVAQNIYPTGEIDNHGWHPSLNYGAVVPDDSSIIGNILQKKGYSQDLNFFSRNVDLTYQVNFKNLINLNTFHRQQPGLSHTDSSSGIYEDQYYFTSDGTQLVTDIWSWSKPSLLEDWTSAWSFYSVPENVGDYQTATTFAQNVYYGFYDGAGKLFCPHGSSTCTASNTNLYNFQFTDALWSLLLSARSNFAQELPSTPLVTSAPPTCQLSTRATYVDSSNGITQDLISVGPNYYSRGDNPGWTTGDLTVGAHLSDTADAPCYGKTPGNCVLTTRSLFYDSNGKLTDSITVGANAYNYTYGTGWWAMTHDLASTPRYKENDQAPCWGKSAGQCTFTTRYLYIEKGTTNTVEAITVGHNNYVWSTNVGWWPSTNHDLAGTAYYTQNQYAPCYGKAAGTCSFTSTNRYYDSQGVLTETVYIGDRYYNYSFNSTGWWPISDNHVNKIVRYWETNGPCLVNSIATPPPSATPIITPTPTQTPAPSPSTTPKPSPTITPNPSSTPSPTPIPGDLNQDHHVDFVDLLLELKTFATSQTIFTLNRLIKNFGH